MKPRGGAAAAGPEAPCSIRIDRLLVYLRFARTRTAAQVMIDTHALRRNRKHVLRGSEQARIGDVLTIALGGRVRVIELLALPDRRQSPGRAPCHYREVAPDNLDPKAQMPIAASPGEAGTQPDRS